jgi:hypothetical protein
VLTFLNPVPATPTDFEAGNVIGPASVRLSVPDMSGDVFPTKTAVTRGVAGGSDDTKVVGEAACEGQR